MTLYQIRECDICNREMARWTGSLLGWTEYNVCDDCKKPFEDLKKKQRERK